MLTVIYNRVCEDHGIGTICQVLMYLLLSSVHCPNGAHRLTLI